MVGGACSHGASASAPATGAPHRLFFIALICTTHRRISASGSTTRGPEKLICWGVRPDPRDWCIKPPLFRPLICTCARRNSAACGTNQGDAKRRFAVASAPTRATGTPPRARKIEGPECLPRLLALSHTAWFRQNDDTGSLYIYIYIYIYIYNHNHKFPRRARLVVVDW